MWRFWERGIRKLPRQIQKYLSKKFNLSLESTVNFRCLTKNGKFSGRRVTYIIIFDLAQIKEREIKEISYSRFPPALILFEGHFERPIEREGSINLRAKTSIFEKPH